MSYLFQNPIEPRKTNYHKNERKCIYDHSTGKSIPESQLVTRKQALILLNGVKNSQLDRYIKEGRLTKIVSPITGDKYQYFLVQEIHDLLCERIALRIDQYKRECFKKFLEVLINSQKSHSQLYQNGLLSVFMSEYKIPKSEFKDKADFEEYERGRQEIIKILELKFDETGRLIDDKFIKHPEELLENEKERMYWDKG